MRFEKAVQARPDDGAAWNDLAVACEAEGRIPAAFEAYTKAAAIRRVFLTNPRFA